MRGYILPRPMSSSDDPRDPFEDLFRELERMMNEMFGDTSNVRVGGPEDVGFGSETHVDIQETGEEIRVIADLPGVTKDEITLQCDGRILTIAAEGPRREYDERIDLPARVNESAAEASYNNGILEVVLQRANDSADIDVT